MNRIAVLMSTYNGEKYIREQIDSILDQKNVSLDLFIRDDGSSDNTVNIIKEYLEQNNNIHLVCGENVGVGNSFMNLLYSAPDDFDFYAFSDQDDIWDENKLHEAATLLQKTSKYLYASNMECVDEGGNTQGIRFKDEEIFIKPAHILGFNMLAGCTLMMSNEFYKILVAASNRPSSDLLKLRIHDVWVVMVASLYDKIIYDSRSFIKYRQHEHNTSGGVKFSWRRSFKEHFKAVFNKEKRNRRSKLALEICKKYPDIAECYPEILYFSKIKQFKSKKWIIKNKKIFIEGTGENKVIFSLKVLFGLI